MQVTAPPCKQRCECSVWIVPTQLFQSLCKEKVGPSLLRVLVCTCGCLYRAAKIRAPTCQCSLCCESTLFVVALCPVSFHTAFISSRSAVWEAHETHTEVERRDGRTDKCIVLWKSLYVMIFKWAAAETFINTHLCSQKCLCVPSFTKASGLCVNVNNVNIHCSFPSQSSSRSSGHTVNLQSELYASWSLVLEQDIFHQDTHLLSNNYADRVSYGSTHVSNSEHGNRLLVCWFCSTRPEDYINSFCLYTGHCLESHQLPNYQTG